MRVGVDVGGTFTDLVALGDGQLVLHKVSSTPEDPSLAVVRAVHERSISLPEVLLFAHGTTVTTNAVIQRRGAPTGLLTTKGFRDVLQIRRTTRGALYDFQWDPPPELVPREWRREVAERVDADGNVVRRPDVEEAVREVACCARLGVPFKATAGLHHPLPHPDPVLNIRQHGFLNVIGGALLAVGGQVDEGELVALLEDDAPNSFRLDHDGFSWRGHRLTPEEIERGRRLVTCFGSCSFLEPMEGLVALLRAS